MSGVIFVKLVKFIEGDAVSDSLQNRLDSLEILYSEQEYTIQSLNQTVTQQDREISRLNLRVERLGEQLRVLKDETGSEISPETEKPPHY